MARTTRLLTAALPASSPRSKSCDFLSAFRLPFGCAPIFARPSDKQCRGLPHACPTASYSSALCRRRCAPTCLRCFGNTRVLPLSPYVRKWSGLRCFGNTSDCPLYPYVRDPAFCGGSGIPESGWYSHTSASVLVCGGMGIPEPRQYPRAYAIMCVCGVLGIPASGWYSCMYASGLVCVGMGILASGWYSRTAAKSHAGRLM